MDIFSFPIQNSISLTSSCSLMNMSCFLYGLHEVLFYISGVKEKFKTKDEFMKEKARVRIRGYLYDVGKFPVYVRRCTIDFSVIITPQQQKNGLTQIKNT